MPYNNWSARHKQSKPGEFRQYRNPGQEVSLKNGTHGHPMHDGPKYRPQIASAHQEDTLYARWPVRPWCVCVPVASVLHE